MNYDTVMISNYWNRLKGYPYLYHLVLIAGAVTVLLLAAHYVMRIGTRHGQHRTVPDFTGLALDDAGRLARRNSLELRVNDSLYVPAYDGGVVLDQLPREGTQVKGGRTVYVTINSFAQKKVDVPYVAGRSLRQAKNMLEIAGLEIDRLVYRPDMATNYVLEQRVEGRPVDPATKRQLEMGSGVTLYVGVAEGEAAVVVPKVIGVSLREAKSRLWEQGLNVGAVAFDEGIDLLNQKDARVYLQQPVQGHATVLGSTVELRLTLDAEKIARESAASDKQARALVEERERELAAIADSLAEAEVQRHAEELQRGAPAAAEEDHFF